MSHHTLDIYSPGFSYPGATLAGLEKISRTLLEKGTGFKTVRCCGLQFEFRGLYEGHLATAHKPEPAEAEEQAQKEPPTHE